MGFDRGRKGDRGGRGRDKREGFGEENFSSDFGGGGFQERGGFGGGGGGRGGFGDRGGFGGGGGGGGGNPFDADYSALTQISKTTGGTFYRAEDASQLSSALAKLPAAFTIVHKHVDIAALFAALGGLLIAAAVALSLWWNRVRRPAPRPEVSRS